MRCRIIRPFPRFKNASAAADFTLLQLQQLNMMQNWDAQPRPELWRKLPGSKAQISSVLIQLSLRKHQIGRKQFPCLVDVLFLLSQLSSQNYTTRNN